MKARVVLVLAVCLTLMAPCFVFAATNTGSDETFSEVAGMVRGWLEGSLGQVIALSALAVGLAMGVLRQSIMASVVGVAMALVAYYGPTIVVEGLALTGTSADALDALAHFVS